MPVDESLVGRTYPPSRVYEVSREKIREFAAAIGDASVLYRDPEAARAAGYPDVVAPPTFPIVFALDAALAAATDPSVGIDYTRVVHGEQKFTYARPLRPGDRLVTTVEITAARHMAGNDLLTLACHSATEDGEHVVTSLCMVVGRGEDA
ncbi:MAG: MaoC family dehydratase N-terminal domain-containing protein [Sporichthyaceae bacterium]